MQPEEGIGPSQLGIVVVVNEVVVVELDVVLLEVAGVSFPVCAPVIPKSQLKKSVTGSAASAGVAIIEIKNIEKIANANVLELHPMQKLSQSLLINYTLQSL